MTAEFCVPSKSLVAVTTIVLTSPTVASQGTLNVAVIGVLEFSAIVTLQIYIQFNLNVKSLF